MNISISVPTKHQFAVLASHSVVAAGAAISALAFAGVLSSDQVKDATADVNRIVADLKDMYGAIAGLVVIAMAVYSTVKSGPIGSFFRAALQINSDPKLLEKVQSASIAEKAPVVAITDALPEVAGVPTKPTEQGTQLAFAVPSRTVAVAAKTVLLLAALAMGSLAIAGRADAAQRKGGFIPTPIVSALNALKALVEKDGQNAIKLSTQIPELPDYVGQACLTQINLIAKVVDAHPLPDVIELASDIEAARLIGLALNQICKNPNCNAMWTDAQNVVAAVNPSQIPVSLPSICAKVPVVSNLDASALPATATPASMPAAPPDVISPAPASK